MRNDHHWNLYFKKTLSKEPRTFLKQAIELFENENKIGKAFDLGSGACNETVYLLSKSWEVISVDAEPQAKTIFEKLVGNNTKASFQLTSYEKIQWQAVDLVHAGYSLPFCPKEHIDKVMQNIIEHIKKGGRFAGNFFGTNHSWTDLCLLSKEQVLHYFQDFGIEFLDEYEEDKLSTLGEEIHMHNIEIIAKKK